MLRVERDAGIVRLSLDRPDVRNAFNAELIELLTLGVSAIRDSDRVVHILGTGDAFCAGGDLYWMREQASQSFEENERDAFRLFSMFNAIQNCPIPVVSQVHGFCFGGGCGIVAASDIVIAAPGTLFAFSEAKLGLIPATISPFVKAKIGAAARELFVTASPFDAETALRIGLVNVLGGSEEVEKRIKCILACGPEAVRASKQLALNEPLGSQAAASLLAETRTRAEAQEGIAAFLEKRKPNFGGTA